MHKHSDSSLARKKPHVLVIISGSIAAYKTCHVISRLVQAGVEVDAVMTRSAQEFVGIATIEGLTGNPVYTDTFERGAYMAHIHLVRRADVILLCPASANILNKMSKGIADDLATTLFLAHDFTKPWLIAPAMNTTMYRHPATKASLAVLQEYGCTIFGTARGMLACGEIGEGKLEDPDAIVAHILHHVQPKTPHNNITQPKRILITSGGTKERIDPVRVLTNLSTGATGAMLADTLAEAGHDVTLLSAEHSIQAMFPTIAHQHFSSFEDIALALQNVLSQEHIDILIHSAAISDYSPQNSSATKLSSHDDTMTITLKRNPKLIDMVKTWSKNPALHVVAFKLTADDAHEQSLRRDRLYATAQPDMIIANDMATLPAWTSYRAIDGTLREDTSGADRFALAKYLAQYISTL